jgi:hypothetical protein
MPSTPRSSRRRYQHQGAQRSQSRETNRLWIILGTVVAVGIVAAIIGVSVNASHGSSPVRNSPSNNSQASTTAYGHPIIDGIPCNPNEQVTYHIHAKLDIFVHGHHFKIPPFIGIPDNPPFCFYYIHTHGWDQYAQGVIHVEYPHKATPTLKQFFDIWLHTRSDDDGPVHAILKGGPDIRIFVNHKPYHGRAASITITPHKLITIEVGKPFVPPANYTFPPGV